LIPRVAPRLGAAFEGPSRATASARGSGRAAGDDPGLRGPGFAACGDQRLGSATGRGL